MNTWLMKYQHPWEIILIKAWSKLKGGYNKVRTAKPAEFMQAISRSCWKYFNLTVGLDKKDKEFFKRYDSKRLNNTMVVLKTKDDTALSKYGLLQNSCSYELIDYKKTK